MSLMSFNDVSNRKMLSGTPLQPRTMPMAARRGASVIRNIVPEPQKKAVPEDVIACAHLYRLAS